LLRQESFGFLFELFDLFSFVLTIPHVFLVFACAHGVPLIPPSSAVHQEQFTPTMSELVVVPHGQPLGLEHFLFRNEILLLMADSHFTVVGIYTVSFTLFDHALSLWESAQLEYRTRFGY
jgi:hypothetical protein